MSDALERACANQVSWQELGELHGEAREAGYNKSSWRRALGQVKPADVQAVDAQAAEVRAVDAQAADERAAESQAVEVRAAESQAVDAHAADV